MIQKYKEDYNAAAHRVRLMVAGGRLTFGAVGIAHSSSYRADMQELSCLMESRDCLFSRRVHFNSELDLDEVIQWVLGEVNRSAREPALKPRRSEPKRETRRSETVWDTHRSSGQGSNGGAADVRPPKDDGLNIDDVVCVFFDLNRSRL